MHKPNRANCKGHADRETNALGDSSTSFLFSPLGREGAINIIQLRVLPFGNFTSKETDPRGDSNIHTPTPQLFTDVREGVININPVTRATFRQFY